MKAKLVSIGDSKSGELPASVVEECGFGAEIDLRVEDGCVVLAPSRSARADWDAAFAHLAAESDDAPVWSETGATAEAPSIRAAPSAAS